MEASRIIQGRSIGISDLDLIRTLLVENPGWGRTRLSEELCRIWSWRSASGRPKEMACRSLLLKLDRGGQIALPPARRPANNELRNGKRRDVVHATDPVDVALRDLTPLQLNVVESRGPDFDLFGCLLDKYHYLGHRSCVGENQKYLLRDRGGRPLCCLLFGSSAWTTTARDEYIGWDRQQRLKRLQWVTNNTRFLILPWVRVENLASHVLSLVCKRIRRDWLEKYGHPVSLLETFVDHSRFSGTCYRAANWQHVGHSTGRTRNSRTKAATVSSKGIYVYPLVAAFRRELCGESTKPLVERPGR